jgi:hypothetical protein
MPCSATCFMQIFELYTYDTLYLALQHQWAEHDHLIDTVQKLRPQRLPQQIHHHVPWSYSTTSSTFLSFRSAKLSCITMLPILLVIMMSVFLKFTTLPLLSVRRPSSSTCSNTLNVSGCGFLNLVEQHHAIWLPAYRLSKLPTLVIAYISRRRAYQPAHAVFFLVFAHVYARHHAVVVKEHFSKRLRQFCLTHTQLFPGI